MDRFFNNATYPLTFLPDDNGISTSILLPFSMSSLLGLQIAVLICIDTCLDCKYGAYLIPKFSLNFVT